MKKLILTVVVSVLALVLGVSLAIIAGWLEPGPLVYPGIPHPGEAAKATPPGR